MAPVAPGKTGEIGWRFTQPGQFHFTIKHGPVPSIDMPPMTMVYQVKDASLLERAKAGDKVRFDAQKMGQQYFVTKIEQAK
jgi:Cu/Ag efflux protein CusF